MGKTVLKEKLIVFRRGSVATGVVCLKKHAGKGYPRPCLLISQQINCSYNIYENRMSLMILLV